jgi:hypothetical protein
MTAARLLKADARRTASVAAPMAWTPVLVYTRMVEAFDTLRRLPGGLLRPEGDSAGNYAEPIRTFSDALAAEAMRDPRKWHPSFYRLAPPEPAAVDRMHEAFGWPLTYLGEHPVESRALLEMAKAEACGMPIAKLCRLKGWARPTLYRRRDEACGIIATGLRRDLVPPRLRKPAGL